MGYITLFLSELNWTTAFEHLRYWQSHVKVTFKRLGCHKVGNVPSCVNSSTRPQDTFMHSVLHILLFGKCLVSNHLPKVLTRYTRTHLQTLSMTCGFLSQPPCNTDSIPWHSSPPPDVPTQWILIFYWSVWEVWPCKEDRGKGEGTAQDTSLSLCQVRD